MISESLLFCPNCESNRTVNNGSTHHKNPNFSALACGRQFLQAHFKKTISPETNNLIDKLLLEKISLAAIARVPMFLKNACKIMSRLTMLKFLEKRSSAQKKEK